MIFINRNEANEASSCTKTMGGWSRHRSRSSSHSNITTLISHNPQQTTKSPRETEQKPIDQDLVVHRLRSEPLLLRVAERRRASSACGALGSAWCRRECRIPKCGCSCRPRWRWIVFPDRWTELCWLPGGGGGGAKERARFRTRDWRWFSPCP